MPQPRQATPPPRQQSGRGDALAVAGTGVAATVATASPAATALAADATTAAAAAAVAKRIAEALLRFGRKRAASADDFVLDEIAHRYPDRPKREAREIVDHEAEFEEAFRRKQLERVQTALREALAEPDPQLRARRIDTILEAEKRYTRLREAAMLSRSISRQEQRVLMETSPAGAYWKLSPYVKEHTLDCLMMGERFWPWTVLREFAPPLHHGCPCGLLGLDEAISQGLMTAAQVPDPADAHQAYRDIRDQLDGLEEAFGIIVVDEEALSDDGLDPREWLLEAAIAIDPDTEAVAAPIGGWDAGIQFEHGPPADPDIDSNLVQHAKRELHLAGLDRPDSDYDGMIATAVLDMVRTHSREGHSGFSHAMTMSALTKLLNFENLVPLTDDPAEWVNHGKMPGDKRYPKGMWQNSRNGRAFSADGGKTYKLLDDRTPGGRKQDKTYTSAPKSTKLREANDQRDSDLEPVRTERLSKPGARRRHRLRWDKGWVKGGQFKPQRGGISNRSGVRRLKLRLGRPKPPAENTRGRWQFVGGTYTRIPEASRWERNVDGVSYSSPPGSTNVYREGRLISTPTADLHPDARRRGRAKPAIATPQVPADKAEAIEELRAKMRGVAADRAKAAVASGAPSKPPVSVGDGPEALGALRDAGFRVNAGAGLYGGRTEFVHPSGARLRIRVDRADYSVREVDWQPHSVTPRAPRRRIDKPPQTWESLVADGLALADRMGKEYGAQVLVPEIHVDPKLEDHAGNHEWDGEVRIGKEAPVDLELAAKAQRDGKPLDEFEARGLYATYRTLAHEIGHGINPIDATDYDGAGRHTEEALTEENAVLDAEDWLTRHKQHAALAWADAHPTNITVAGSYLHERGALSGLFDQAGITDPAERVKLLRELKFRTPPAERIDHLGLLVFDEDQRSEDPHFESLEDAIAHVELTMDHAADSTRPGGVLWGHPKTVTFTPPVKTPDVPDVKDPLADAAVAMAGRPHQPAIDRIAELDPSAADATQLALTGDRDARWELAQRAPRLGADGRAQIESLVGPLGHASHGIPTVLPDQVDSFLAGAAWSGLMHYGADREVATKLLGGKAPIHDPGLKYRLWGTGFVGTSSTDAAKGAPRMRGPKGAVVDVAMRLDHPLMLDDAGDRILGDIRARAGERFEPDTTDHADYVRTSLLAAGYDGVVRSFPDGETVAVALEPEHQVAAVQARKVPSLIPFRPITATTREVGPDVAAGRTQIAGAIGGDPLAASLGTGARFGPGDGAQRISLNDANLYRPRDSYAALDVHDAMRSLDDYADAGLDDDDRLGGIADRLPHGDDPLLAVHAARQAVARHRDASTRNDATADTAATEAMRALGWDGVDVRHIDGFPAESVLYRRREPEAMADPGAMDSASGGAVVGGVAGRWVWIRGTYRHIPHGTAYDETADGVRFYSPEGSTDVYRLSTNPNADRDVGKVGTRVLVYNDLRGNDLGAAVIEGYETVAGGNEFYIVRLADGQPRRVNPSATLVQVARPRWTNHPDVRRPPRGQSTRRRRGQVTTTRRPPVAPPPVPRPFVDPRPAAIRLATGEAPRIGMMVREGQIEGRITRVDGAIVHVHLDDGREWTLPTNDTEAVIPELAQDQRVRVHTPDGSFLGIVRAVNGDATAQVELDNGTLFAGPPVHASMLEVLGDPPRRPEGAPLLTDDVLVDLMGARPADASDGAELVPGVRYSRALPTAVTANKLPAELVVGPSFFNLPLPARIYALTNAQGYGLWNSIEGDEDALQELHGMWTDGRMSAEVDGQRVHLDRYSLPAAVAAGYAKLNAGDWAEQGALYPDALRWLALQAERRGYPLAEGVGDWARRTDIGGANDDDPAAVLARTLEGKSFPDLRDILGDEGYRARSQMPGQTTFVKVDGGEVRIIDVRTNGDQVTHLAGFTHAQPGGDDPVATLAEHVRGMRPDAAQVAFEEAGWRSAGPDYGDGTATWNVMVSADGSREARIRATGAWSERVVQEVLVGPLSGTSRAMFMSSEMRRADGDSAIDPALIGQPEDMLRHALTSANWSVVYDAGGWLTVRRTRNAENVNVTVEEARFHFEDGRVSEVGRPSAGDRSFAPSEAEYRARVDTVAAGLRRDAEARDQRRRELAERIRVSVNGGIEPFTGGENFEDVRAAMRLLDGWDTPSNGRSLADGGSSVTYKNRRTGAKLIVRRDAPDVNGITKVRAASRVTAGRSQDLGRNRITGRLPASREEWESDVLGRSDEHRRAQSAAQNDIQRVKFYEHERVNEYSADHAGVHMTTQIGIGARALPDLLEAHQLIAAGGTLSDDQCSRVYASYKVLQHEINHGVRGLGAIDYSNEGGKGIEEALTEELTHVDMVEWMRSHGLEQVVRWAQRTEGHGASGVANSRLNGSYLTHRQNFRRVLERAGMLDDPGLVDLMRRLKFRTNGFDRRAALGRLVARHEGTTDAQGLAAVLETMQGDHSVGTRIVGGFRPILAAERRRVRAPIGGPDPDTGGTEGGGPRAEFPADSRWHNSLGTPFTVARVTDSMVTMRFTDTGGTRTVGIDVFRDWASNGTITRASGGTRRVGDWVKVRPARGRGFRGRVIEVGTGENEGKVKVRKIGRGEEVWADANRATLVDRDGNPTPERGGPAPPPGPGPAPRPPRSSAPYASDGRNGMLGVGAIYRGTSTGKLGTITGITDLSNASVRRADGSTYTGASSQFTAIVITNEGYEFKVGDSVRSRRADGELNQPTRIHAIDYRDAQRPLVQFSAAGDWVEARTLEPAREQPVATVRSSRTNQNVDVVKGSRVKLRDGTVAEVLGPKLLEWPLGPRTVRVRVGGREQSVQQTDIVGIAGEQPAGPNGYRADVNEVYALANAHFRRQNVAVGRAKRLMAPVNAQIADQVEEWWRAKGWPIVRGRPKVGDKTYAWDKVLSEAYGRIFESRDADAGMGSELRVALNDIANTTGLPLPDWSDSPRPPLRPGDAPPGNMFDEAVLRHTWTGQFGRTGMTAVVDNVTSDGSRSAQVTGRILNRNGNGVGTFTRSVSTDPEGNPFVYHAYLSINRQAQGGGFASAFNRNAESIYRAKGVKYVKVSADIDVGGYAWAATGFDFVVTGTTPETRARKRAVLCRNYLDGGLRSGQITRAEYDSVVGQFVEPGFTGTVPEGKVQHAWELAGIGGHARRGGPETMGQRMLLNKHWAGIKHLVGAERSPLAGTPPVLDDKLWGFA